VDKPTCAQMVDEEGLASVYREDDATWRHGAYVTEVFLRAADQTFWRAKYRRSADGETNGLADGSAKIVQVFPYDVTVTKYREVSDAR